MRRVNVWKHWERKHCSPLCGPYAVLCSKFRAPSWSPVLGSCSRHGNVTGLPLNFPAVRRERMVSTCGNLQQGHWGKRLSWKSVCVKPHYLWAVYWPQPWTSHVLISLEDLPAHIMAHGPASAEKEKHEKQISWSHIRNIHYPHVSQQIQKFSFHYTFSLSFSIVYGVACL